MSEVLEAEEFFSEGQKGSSAMPHKRNPVLSENLTGLSRMVRAYALPAIEDDRILHDVAKAIRSASETHVRKAGEILTARFIKPVLFAWAADDPVFPLAHARAYAEKFADACVELF